jgi:hypothetical protein
MRLRLLLAAAIAAPLALAVDTVYLRGQVKLADGTAPGKSVDIQLVCRNTEPIRMLTAGKNGVFNLKAERDEFNHIARALPSTAMDLGDATRVSGPCVLKAALKGYSSSSIDLDSFIVPKDMRLPDLTLTPLTQK